MAHRWQDRSIKTIFSRKHTMNHTRLEFIDSDSLTASSALKLEPRTAESATPSSFLLFAPFLWRSCISFTSCLQCRSFSAILWGMGLVWVRSLPGTSTGCSVPQGLVNTGSWSLTALNFCMKDLPLLLLSEGAKSWWIVTHPAPAQRHQTQSPLCLLLSQFILPVTCGFSFRKLPAIFTRISVSRREQASFLGTMPNHHCADTAWCSLHPAELLAVLSTNPTSKRWHKTSTNGPCPVVMDLW